jgi:hypothetical protein
MIHHHDNSSTDRFVFCGESKDWEILPLLLEQPFEANNGKNNGQGADEQKTHLAGVFFIGYDGKYVDIGQNILDNHIFPA